MHQRLTYLLPAGANVESSDIVVRKESLEFSKAAQAGEEWRVKLELAELPNELQGFLDHCNDIHLRWSSPSRTSLIAPLNSHLPPGLHVFFTPKQSDRIIDVCQLLDRLLETKAKCFSVPDSFAGVFLSSEQHAQRFTYQWHQLSRLSAVRLGNTVLGRVCSDESADSAWRQTCAALISDFASAASIDLDFDANDQSLVLKVLWGPNDGISSDVSSQKLPRRYRKAREEETLEIGVLQEEPSKQTGKLSLGGYLTMIGDNLEPKITRFSFPSRHLPPPSSHPATFTTSFQTPTGLHPKLQINLPRSRLQPPEDSCALYAYFTLPSTVFIDRYQLSDPLFLDSQNLIALRSLAGEQDLEAPDWVTTRWGSVALLELATPSTSTTSAAGGEDWQATLPLHLRYIDRPQTSTDPPDQATLQVPWPVVFWACDADKKLKLANNPFDRTDLGYDGLFGPNTAFYHIPPAANVTTLVEEIKVPILNAEHAEQVRLGTLLAVAAGFLWVCWQLLKAARTGHKR